MKEISELKKAFDPMKVPDIERLIESNKSASVECERKFILALYYLEHTSRFREIDRYKKATFGEYISDRYAINITTFKKLALVYIRFEKEAETYGPGMVLKAVNQCGPSGAVQVFKETAKAQNEKKMPVTRKAIMATIAKHKRNQVNFKAIATNVKAENKELKEKNTAREKELLAIIEARDTQIEKLKKALSQRDEKIKKLSEEISRLATNRQTISYNEPRPYTPF